MSRKEGSTAENKTYTDLVLNIFRQNEPYTFFTTSSIAAHIESIQMEYASQIVMGSIQNMRKWSHLETNEAILSVFGTQGYLWTPDLSMAQSCLPTGFRSDVFFGYPGEHQQALSIAWDAMRVVDVSDQKTAYPRVKDAIYQDMMYFAEHIGQNISLEGYAQILNRDVHTANQRIRIMARFLESIPEAGLAIITSRGFSEYRLDLQS